MKKSLVIKISLIISVALMIFSVVAGVVTMDNDTKIMERELIRLTNLYGEYAGITSAEEAANISDKDKDVRVSVIALDGRVIADSLSVENHENHLYREEVQNAINGIKDKVVVRFSETARQRLAYYAVMATVEGESVIVRASIPSVNLNGFVVATIVMFVVMVIAITALTAAMISTAVNSSMKPLKVLKSSLDDVKNGTYKSIMPSERYVEINELISGINDVADNLSDTMRELNSEREKLNYLMENMSESVIAADADDMIVMSNSKAKELLNASYGTYIDMALCDKELEKAYRSANKDNAAVCVFERNGRYYRFSATGTPSDSEDIAKIIIISDITKTKLAETERREFFSNCSHELKTPLAVIKGYGELIANGMAKGNKISDYGRSIASDSDKLLSIIEDMLILSRLDENITGEPQPIEIKSMISDMVKDFAATDKLGLSVAIAGDDITVNMANKNAEGLFRNVIENAYKYNSINGKIDINARKLSDGRAEVTVVDTGEGIPYRDLKRITERFYRVEKSRSDKRGSGLGLAIVKHICQLYDIEFRIESEENCGTAVTLIFPQSALEDESKRI